MISPESRLKGSWDFFVFLTAIYAALIIPLSLVVPELYDIFVRWSFRGIWIVFVLDIIVHANTSIFREGRHITDRSAVLREYFTGWFWVDLIAVIPTFYILARMPGSFSPLLFLLQLNPLIKLIKSKKILRRVMTANINPAILRLFLLVFWILLAAHIISCGWIYIRENPQELAPVPRYVEAFYWTITTLTTIGYGDITPTGQTQILFVVIVEILGAGMYGLVIGNIANLIANIDVAKTQYKEKLDKMNAFMKYRNLPPDLQKKINNYYNYLWETRRGYDESTVLEDLSAPLKVSVSLFLNKDIIEKVPFFENAGDDLIKEVIMNLRPVVFTPGDYIVRAGELGFDMFFISRGSVDVVSADESTVYATLTEGQFFGEIALLLSTTRTATIKAKEYCDLYCLDKDTFDRILTRYPDFEETIQKLADKRKAEIEAKTAPSAKKPKGPASVDTVTASNASGMSKEEGETRREVPEEENSTPEKIASVIVELKESKPVIHWKEAKGAKKYEVVRLNPETGKWTVIANSVSSPIYTDLDNYEDKQNIYRIRGINNMGAGLWSEPAEMNLTS